MERKSNLSTISLEKSLQTVREQIHTRVDPLIPEDRSQIQGKLGRNAIGPNVYQEAKDLSWEQVYGWKLLEFAAEKLEQNKASLPQADLLTQITNLQSVYMRATQGKFSAFEYSRLIQIVRSV